jgi:CTP:molybdopterin cytidylyltransferase MocA
VSVAGLLLAAGEGRRYGMPKALVTSPDGVPWIRSRATVLADGGCSPVVVVLGAEVDRARRLLPKGVVPVVAEGWAEGMGASLRTGLAAVQGVEPVPEAVLVALVDTPGLTADAVARLAALASPVALAQATYGGQPGHPVLIGREHWDGVAAVAHGDRGARDYLLDHGAESVECGDVASGEDVDEPLERR